jgi:hypothetical protein
MSKQPTASTFMPLRGEKRWAYLKREKTIRLATTGADHSVYLSPLWYVINERRILIPIDAAGRHAENLLAGRPAIGLVDSGDEYATVHGVRIEGKGVVVDDKTTLLLVEELLFEKYFYVGHPYAESYFQFGNAAKRTVFELRPEKMIGWDMREIALPQVPEARVLPDFIKDRLV